MSAILDMVDIRELAVIFDWFEIVEETNLGCFGSNLMGGEKQVIEWVFRY